MLAYLSRYTHRVTLSNSRLLAMDEHGVTLKWKDYRVKDGAQLGAGSKTRHKTMTLTPGEFMRRFLLHVLPGGFHRIRHYGILANGSRKASLALARTLLGQTSATHLDTAHADNNTVRDRPSFVCAHCGAAMIILAELHARAVHPCTTHACACAMTAQALHCSHRWLTRRPRVSACTVVSCRCLFARPRRTSHPAYKRASLADGRNRGMVDLHAQRMATTHSSKTPTIAIVP